MDFHVLKVDRYELIAQVIDGQLVIVPPAQAEQADILDKTTVSQPCDRHLPETT